MHSQRKSIRLAAIAALTNQDAPPFPTMAQDRVYDSRQDPLIHARGQSSLPCICVYTDSTQRTPVNQGHAPFTGTIELILEMSLGGVGESIETDSELEGRLDDFEEQAIEALFGVAIEGAMSFAKTYKRIHKIDSLRLANSEHASRLAMRDLAILLEFNQSCKDVLCAFPKFERLHMLATLDGEKVALSEDTLV